jgi:D-alanyl-lipoteichoic acid acyltransferase DltB (MBOAT superfamily)
MIFNNYIIFQYVISFILLFNLVKLFTKNDNIRNILFFVGNFFLLSTLVFEYTIIIISAISIFIYAVGLYLQKRNSKSILAVAIIIIIALWAIRNYPTIQDLLERSVLSFINAPILSVQKIGLSYILFRYIHWLVESKNGNIRKSNLFIFLNYILFFPTILAGPIDTYKNFQFWMRQYRRKYSRIMFFAGITRILIGAIKTLAIVPLLINYATDYKLLTNDFSPIISLALSLLAYSAYIYIDFSGYSDIAIGSAYLLGIKTPENFNNPYLSTNLSDFWKKWHITFSTFLKIYVFKPTIFTLNKLILPKNRLLVTVLAYLITFVICGIWHGNQINFVYWGLWHGMGLGINKIFTTKFKSKIKYVNTNYYKIISIFITFIFVTFGWMFFNYSHEQLIEIFISII